MIALLLTGFAVALYRISNNPTPSSSQPAVPAQGKSYTAEELDRIAPPPFVVTTTRGPGPEPSIDALKQEATRSARLLEDKAHFSRARLFEEFLAAGYPSDVVEHAIAHMDADFTQEALARARMLEPLGMSDDELYSFLTSPDREMFTPAQAQYAVDWR